MRGDREDAIQMMLSEFTKAKCGPYFWSLSERKMEMESEEKDKTRWDHKACGAFELMGIRLVSAALAYTVTQQAQAAVPTHSAARRLYIACKPLNPRWGVR